MSSSESDRSSAGLTALPTVEQLRRAGDGYDEQGVREAFDAFRRHTAQLQAQLRVLQAARTSSNVSPTGHAVRMDALHLIRAAAEFADTLERDAQTASATQLQRTEEEVSAKQKVPAGARGRDRALPHRVGAPAVGDPERREGRSPRPPRQVERRRHARAARSGDAWQPAARAVAPSGDRAHELRPRRGRADARVGSCAGDRRHGSCPEGRRAVARGCRARRAGDQPGRPVDRRGERQRDRTCGRDTAGAPSRGVRGSGRGTAALRTACLGARCLGTLRLDDTSESVRARAFAGGGRGSRRGSLPTLPPSRRPTPPTLGRPSRPMTGSPSPSGSRAHARSTLAAIRARSVLPDRRRRGRRPARPVVLGDRRCHGRGVRGDGRSGMDRVPRSLRPEVSR